MLSIIFALAIMFWLYNNLSAQKQKASEPVNQTTNNDVPGEDNNLNTLLFEKPAILNGDFEEGQLGWQNPYAIQSEENGNHYILSNYSWRVVQNLDLLPHTTYEICASTKKGTAEGPARIAFTFLDVNDNKLFQNYDIKYTHYGTEWEEIPNQFITIPDNAAVTKIYLLSNDPKGYHLFDNISIRRVSDVGERKALDAASDQDELLVNGNFELGLYGWIGYASLIETEDDNKFIRNGYNWEVFQPLEVVPGQQYMITAKTRMVTPAMPARIKIIFYDQDGQRAPEFYNILHTPASDGWETKTELIQIPANYSIARVYLLADHAAGDSKVDFDDLSFKPVSEEELENYKVSAENTEVIRGVEGQHIKYVVQSGDTASIIAQRFGISVEDLIDENSLTDPDRLEVGQIIYILQK